VTYQPDHCGCTKPRGDFGQGGWHWRMVPNDPDFARKYYGHESYAGTMVAVEQCPAYQDAMKRNAPAKRQEERPRKGWAA
jgi:hypothetical protein